MQDEDLEGEIIDETIEEFDTYEAYLTSFITDTDRYYLEDEDLARALVEFGVHGKGDIYSREDFESKK
jgi:hypothetical protein